MNKYTQKAEEYWNIKEKNKYVDCKLKTALEEFGGGNNRLDCERDAKHIFCNCDHCIKHPTCRRCRLFFETGNYL